MNVCGFERDRNLTCIFYSEKDGRLCANRESDVIGISVSAEAIADSSRFAKTPVSYRRIKPPLCAFSEFKCSSVT